MKYMVDKDEFETLVEDALKFRALEKLDVAHNWGQYYDALADNFEEPQEDYEDFTEIVANFIENNERVVVYV